MPLDLESYIAWRRRLGGASQSVRNDVSAARAFFAYLSRRQVGADALGSWQETNHLVGRWLEAERRAGKAPSTIARLRTAARSFPRWLELPPLDLPPLGAPEYQRPVASEAAVKELDALARRSADPRIRAMLRLIAFAGLRVPEIVALNVGDLDLGDPAELLVGEGRSARRVSLDRETSGALGLLIGDHSDRSRPLIRSRAGSRISVGYARSLIGQLRKRLPEAPGVEALRRAAQKDVP